MDVLHDGAAVDPVDRVDVHAVADEDALLDLLQERADDAQELVRAVVGFAALESPGLTSAGVPVTPKEIPPTTMPPSSLSLPSLLLTAASLRLAAEGANTIGDGGHGSRSPPMGSVVDAVAAVARTEMLKCEK